MHDETRDERQERPGVRRDEAGSALPPLNRAMRRHPHNPEADAIQDNLRSQAANEADEAVTRLAGSGGEPPAEAQYDPAYGRGGDDDGSFERRPDKGVEHDTGAGSGGAVESDGRLTHHEGMHLGNQPNS